ncbi:hypothetical protein SynSYN20_03092 [Synechococcus sp. SYN20]|nr:hypothetical protein SynSYN20_03092 [Synechococcus sp. SYN20]
MGWQCAFSALDGKELILGIYRIWELCLGLSSTLLHRFEAFASGVRRNEFQS